MFRVHSQQVKNQSKKAACLGLGLLVGLTTLAPIASAKPAPQQARKQTYYRPFRSKPEPYVADELMIMPKAGVSDQDLDDALGQADVKVCGTLGKGQFRVIVVKTVKGKVAETEAKLRKDLKHIGLVQRNYHFENDAFSPDDPVFKAGGDAFLAQVKVPKAWDLGAFGAGKTICVIDSGCQATTGDLSGKTEKGYDGTSWDAYAALFSSPIAAAAGLGGGAGLLGGLGLGIGLNLLSDATNPGGNVDKDPDMNRRGHGTECATVAAGSINNVHGVGVAPSARIYPIHDGDNSGDDLAMLAGLWHLMATPGTPRIVSISQGPLYDPGSRPIDHVFFRAFHDLFGGVIFVAAGNESSDTGGSQMSYLNVISA
ncbi:MAG: S8 family serine peptidase, partial [Terriglobales bacterium]